MHLPCADYLRSPPGFVPGASATWRSHPFRARSVCAPQKNCDHRPVQIIAIDWSGRAKGPAESLWLAEVRHGRLTELRTGLAAVSSLRSFLSLGKPSPARSSDWTSPFRFPRGGASRTVGPAGRTCGLPWGVRARICLKDAKTPSGGARVGEIPIRKHGAIGRPREARTRCVRSLSFRLVAPAPWAPAR